MITRNSLMSGVAIILSFVFLGISIFTAVKVGKKIHNKDFGNIKIFILIFIIASFLSGFLEKLSNMLN